MAIFLLYIVCIIRIIFLPLHHDNKKTENYAKIKFREGDGEVGA